MSHEKFDGQQVDSGTSVARGPLLIYANSRPSTISYFRLTSVPSSPLLFAPLSRPDSGCSLSREMFDGRLRHPRKPIVSTERLGQFFFYSDFFIPSSIAVALGRFFPFYLVRNFDTSNPPSVVRSTGRR